MVVLIVVPESRMILLQTLAAAAPVVLVTDGGSDILVTPARHDVVLEESFDCIETSSTIDIMFWFRQHSGISREGIGLHFALF